MGEKEDRGLRRQDVQRVLGISKNTFYRLVKAEKLNAYRINVEYRVRESEVERFRREREMC